MNIPDWLVLMLITSNLFLSVLYFKETDLRWKLYRKLCETKEEKE